MSGLSVRREGNDLRKLSINGVANGRNSVGVPDLCFLHQFKQHHRNGFAPFVQVLHGMVLRLHATQYQKG